MLWSMALHPQAMTYLGFQEAAVLPRYPSWAHSCWGKQGRKLTTSVRPLCVPQLNSYFLSALAGDKNSGTSQTQRSCFRFITLWSRIFFSHVKHTERKQGLNFVFSLGLSSPQVVPFCLGFSHQWTMWTNHPHDSTEIQRLLCILGKHKVNRWNWKSHCIETYMSCWRHFFYIKKIDISCRLMVLVAVTSKEKSFGVSDTAWGTSRREKKYKWSRLIQKVCVYLPVLSPQIWLTQAVNKVTRRRHFTYTAFGFLKLQSDRESALCFLHLLILVAVQDTIQQPVQQGFPVQTFPFCRGPWWDKQEGDLHLIL